MNNSLWNLIIRIASFLAALFLLLGASLTYASHFGLTQNNAAIVLTVFSAAVLGIFALAAVNFNNFRLEREINDATEIAGRIADGELLAEQVKNENELFAALQNISDNMRTIRVEADRIADGDLSANISSRSDADVFGQSLGNMIERLRFAAAGELFGRVVDLIGGTRNLKRHVFNLFN